MKQRTLRRIARPLRVSWLLASVIAIVAGITAHADAPASRQQQAQFEVRFMTRMIDHHAMAVEMGMLCAERAVHSELRMLCEEMVTMQRQEIEQMQSWLRQWYGIEHQPEMSDAEQHRMDRLASLTGADFEVAFMRMMIRHHAQAVVLGSRCVEKAFHQPLIELCMHMVETQTQEIRTMRRWLCQWYRLCNQRAMRDNGNNHK